MTTAPDTAQAASGVVHSADGTPIAWTRQGSGPDLVMVHCVGVNRETTPQPTLPAALAERFTVWTYDRRGTGESGDAEPYAEQREVEDLTAVIGLAAGPVTVYGFSSGAVLALISAAAGAPIQRLALLEPPLSEDPQDSQLAEGRRLLAQGPQVLHHWFQTDVVGVPAEILEEMGPPSPEILRDAPSMLHELTFLPGATAQRFAGVTQPTLLVASDHTIPVMHEWGRRLEQAMPHAHLAIVPGHWHGVDDATLVQVISAAEQD